MLGIVLVLLFATTLIPLTISDAYAKCMVGDECYTPNEEYGVLSIELPSGSLPAHFEYCDPRMKNPSKHTICYDC